MRNVKRGETIGKRQRGIKRMYALFPAQHLKITLFALL